jgi:hypothetical protein
LHLILQYSLFAAAILVMARIMETVLRGGLCLRCGGNGKHRDDCPFKEGN